MQIIKIALPCTEIYHIQKCTLRSGNSNVVALLNAQHVCPKHRIDFAEHIRVVENRIDGNMEKIQTPKEQKQSAAKSLGLGGVIGFFKSLFCGGKKKHSGRCDGNCANCPAHYGYRHGRWYYGHGHNYGCEFGGNKGGGGAD